MKKRVIEFLYQVYSIVKKISQDPLNLLLCAQGVYVFIGMQYLDFQTTWLEVFLTVTTAMVAEIVFSQIKLYLLERRIERISFPRSALAAALGIVLFFRASSAWYYVFAALIAIGSKYVIRYQGKHIFNPSNFAIVVTVFSFLSSTTIEFTQWGTNPIFYLFVLVVSFIIAYRSRVIYTTASFLLSYTFLLILTASYKQALFTTHHYGIISPSMILFASFMITDPKTAPRGMSAGILHGVGVALLYYFLEAVGVRYSLFLASFLMTVLNLLMFFISSRISILLRERFPANIFSVIISLSLFLFSMTPIVLNNSFKTGPILISPQFLAFGIERPPQKCANPVFTDKAMEAGLYSDKTNITGTAWGDYDNDGYDDLYVASSGSYLYHNNKDGTFTDVTQKMGLGGFKYYSGFFADYNNDGRLDLFLIRFPEYEKEGSKPSTSAIVRLFQNNGSSFVDVTKQAGLYNHTNLDDSSIAATLSFADFNNDGYIDFVYAFHGNSFSIDAKSNKAMLKSLSDPAFPQEGELICDASRIRRLMPELKDLAVEEQYERAFSEFNPDNGCILTSWELNVSSNEQIGGHKQGRVVEVVMNPIGKLKLFENHNGIFRENLNFPKLVKESLNLPKSGITKDLEKVKFVSGSFFQPISFDYDNDGLVDIFVSVDRSSNLLLHNMGNFQFENATEKAKVNYYGSGMGVSVADFNKDGLMDIFVDNSLKDYLYKNIGNGTFFNLANDIEIAKDGNGYGTEFIDYDLDGWDDIYIGNGSGFRSQDTSFRGVVRPFFKSDNLYHNEKGKTFTDVTGTDLCVDTRSTKTLAVSDFDNNGTPDVFIGHDDSPSTLMVNNTSGKNYISVKLRGTKSNSMGVGALVTVKSSLGTQTKPVVLGGSYYSESSTKLIFGLGTSTNPVDISVQWPSGIKSLIKGVSINKIITIRE